MRSNILRIVLAGFMGSGKTTVGALLAARLGWRFVDLDKHVEVQHSSSVQQIFAEHGEEFFRAAESEALAAMLDLEHIVLALGGGAADAADNRQRLRNAPETLIVHLDVPFDLAAQRCAAQAALAERELRPLFAESGLAAERFAQRAPILEALAECTVTTADRNPAAIVEELILLAKKSMRPRLG